MKNLLYLLLFASQISFAQNIDFKKFEAQALKVAKTSKHADLIKSFIAENKETEQITQLDLIKDYVGFGIVINPKNNSTKLLPAKYTFDIKTRLSAVGVIDLDKPELTAKQLAYLSAFTKNPSTLAKDEYFRAFKYHTFTNETKLEIGDDLLLKDQNYTTYFTTKNNLIYAIGMNKTSDEFIFYKFDTKVIPNDDYLLIQMEKNRKVKWAEESKLRDVFPLYHDVRIDDIRTALYYLLREEPYKSDKKLMEYAKGMNKKLDRTNIRNYKAELNYFLDLTIDEKFWKYKSDEVLNLKHTSAHALADIYFGSGDFKLAENNFIRSLLSYRLIAAGGTTFQNDANRISYDLSKVYEKIGKPDEMIGYLIPLLNGNGSINSAAALLNTYIEQYKIDKKTLKKQLDASFETLGNLRGDGTYTYMFNGKTVFFLSVFTKTKSSFAKEVMETDFYKSL
ncbi:hypothetical protein [Pedobacter namyangjuensis]|uniref:hypothetical protein n=1 Tax=Pedobacter namyangjuensis TaxID=600626 RepID=UPI000DE304EC|nr:hypothetical protein [Pedobacter namyangjuensis]